MTKFAQVSGTLAAGFLVTLSGCSSPEQPDKPVMSPVEVRMPSYDAAPAPPPASVVPDPQQLTDLYNAVFGVDISPEGRERLIESRGRDNRQISDSLTTDQNDVRFESVEVVSDTKVVAFGYSVFRSGPGPALGPIPFVAEDGVWKVDRDVACLPTIRPDIPCS